MRTIADLHEELLDYLLNYRTQQTNPQFPPITFLLRDDEDPEDKAALGQGWWFLGDTYTIDIFFFIDSNNPFKYYAKISCYFSENNSTQIHLEISAPLQGHTSINISKLNILFPFKLQFLQAIQILEEVKRKISFEEQNIKPIPENLFQKQLLTINNYRPKHPKQPLFKGLLVNNFKAITNTIDLRNIPNNQWIFFTGENGFGKTLLLQAIAAGLYGNKEESIVPPYPNLKAYYELSFFDSKRKLIIENDTTSLGQSISADKKIIFPSHFRPLESLACYGATRLALQSGQSSNDEERRSTATYSLFNPDGLLKNIELELLLSFYESAEKFKMLEEMLKAVVPSLAHITIDKENRKVLYYEKALDSENPNATYPPVTFNQLATGIRGLVAMVGDIYIRLSKVQKKEGVYPHHRDLYGIVIIDEVDAHLHPKWQRQLPSLLSGIFPNIQFIVSTHSPIPLLGAPEGSVFLRVYRTAEEGITVKRLEGLEKEIKNLMPNSILSSPLFGFTDLYSVSNTNGEALRTEDFYDETKMNDIVEKRLKEWLDKKDDSLDKLFKNS